MEVYTLDFETYSEADITKVGAARYAQDPSTVILNLAYGYGDEPPKIWDPEMEEFPQELFRHNGKVGVFEAHNAFFERCICRYVLFKKMRIPFNPPIPQWKCTMAQSYYNGGPGKLEKATVEMKAPEHKDPAGKKLITYLCKPYKGTRRRDIEREEKLQLYAIQDAVAERAFSQYLPAMSDREQQVWQLDQRINDRGLQIDIETVEAAIFLRKEYYRREHARLQEITGGQVKDHDKLADMGRWIGKQGMPQPDSLDKDAVDLLLMDGGIPEGVREVLKIRQELSRSSTKKYDAMLRCAGEDGRARGLIQYFGASTGRFAGRLIQPHNFPRGEYEGDPEDLIEIIRMRDLDLLIAIYGDPMQALVNGLRYCLTAAPGKKLIWGDYSAIEACVVMFLAGQWDAVKVLMNNPSQLYLDLATHIFGHKVTKEEQPQERAVGKASILGCGFQMGGPRFLDTLQTRVGPDFTLDFAQNVVNTYRSKYSRVKDLWYGVQEAALEAVVSGEGTRYRDLEFKTWKHPQSGQKWLFIKLPSGRRLAYLSPTIRMEDKWDTGTFEPCLYVRKWKEGRMQWVSLYGGFITENVTQATARDIMVCGMFEMERRGYPLVLNVHDEPVAEVDEDFGSIAEVEEAICVVDDWAKDYPIHAEGAEGVRYRKD